jgi:chromosome segregation protein
MSSLRLAKLTLAGFKSFADKTEFVFDDPITGIVGPNGCGKSNVVDAIKWVLGERSSKSLRGKEMIDVIFAGSAARKPLGMASVCLTFENPILIDAPLARSHDVMTIDAEAESNAPAISAGRPSTTPDAALPDEEFSEVVLDRASTNRALPIDADIVEVERRLYRDGTSQYLINQKRARLRDIRDLFLDTGIGADAYSIIEQGKVDAMLLASPQERRTIFEEAAGIAKFKQRRIEAQRKLERAQANLTLTREQLATTDRRLKIVKGQAAKARRFKLLDAELRANRLALAFDQYDDLRQRLDGLSSRLVELESVRAEAASALAELESAKQEAELARHDLSTRHRTVQEDLLAARHAEQSAAQRKAMSERALSDAQRQAASDAARLKDLDARAADLSASSESQSSLIAAASEQLAEAERHLEAVGAERAALLESITIKHSALAERRAAAANIDRELAALNASVEAESKREDAVRDQIARTEQKQSVLASDRLRLAAARDALAHAAADRRYRIEALERELAEREAAAASLSRERRDLAERVAALQQQHLRLDGRRQTLHEMVEARVGLGDAVREVLAQRDAGAAFTTVIAPFADLIETDREHAAAVEAALGPALQALVVRTLSDIPSSTDCATLSARVTFLPITGFQAPADAVPHHRWSDERMDESVLASGRALPLRSVVRWRGPVPTEDAPSLPLPAGEAGGGCSLLDRVLASTYLVDSLDSAVMLAAITPGARFVTRDGSVLESDARVHAGPLTGAQGEAAGVLQRRSELVELVTQVESLAADLARERATLESVDADAASLSALAADLRARLAPEQRAHVADHARAEQLASELSRLDRDESNLADEIAQLRTRLATIESDRLKLRDRVTSLKGLHQEQTASAHLLDQEVAQLRLRSDAIGEQITAMRVDASRLSEQLTAARRESRRVELALESAQREKRDLLAVVESSHARVEEHRRVIEESSAQIAESVARALSLDSAVAALAADLESASADLTALSQSLNASRQHTQNVERDWHALEVSRRELEVKRENLEERTQGDLAIDLAAEYADYRSLFLPDDSGFTIARIDVTAATRDVESLREQISSLGNVNLEALEEENTLEARNEELIRQVADIDHAAATLATLIDTLNTACKARFETSFEAIKSQFASDSGMFRKLFGGGKAEVRLMPLIKEVETPEGTKKVETNEIDLLESGIEVIAKPPGKEPRSISQLSGGEKTLTAVALLLAIFRSKPSCFCILDEVDAALDEGNVARYCAVIREFTTHSRFIVITHNKKTMQAADRLFGVTMQERGVSTRVSVKFDQVAKDGSISTNASTERARSASEGASSPLPLPAGEAAGGPSDRPLPSLPEVAPVTETPPEVAADAAPARSRKNLLRKALAGMREDAHETTSN